MGLKILKGMDIYNESSRSYIDAAHTVLVSAGMYDKPAWMLSGMTGMAFITVTHKNLIPASVDVYSLKETAWRAMDILGVYSEMYSGDNNSLTFPLYQKKAIARIKESIDAGYAVIVWAPVRMEFGVIYGYDDEDRVLYFKDRVLGGEHVMLYDNLGRCNATFWMCQVIGDMVQKDIRDIYIDSLEVCVDEWENPYKAEPQGRKEYGSGRKAYEYLISALEHEDFHNYGASRILNCISMSKHETMLYLNEVKKEFPEINDMVNKYNEVNTIYEDIMRMIPPPLPGAVIDKSYIHRLAADFREALRIEEMAVEELRKFLKEVLDNRYVDPFDLKKF